VAGFGAASDVGSRAEGTGGGHEPRRLELREAGSEPALRWTGAEVKACPKGQGQRSEAGHPEPPEGLVETCGTGNSTGPAACGVVRPCGVGHCHGAPFRNGLEWGHNARDPWTGHWA
jgi:hypothetical protein